MALVEKMSESVKGQYIDGKTFWRSRASNSQVNLPIWPKFGFIRDFMPVLVIYKFDKDPIKTEGAIASLTKIGSTLKALAQRHRFPIISQWEF